MVGKKLARKPADTLDHSSRVGGGLWRSDVRYVFRALGDPAENTVHAVSVALASLFEHDLLDLRDGGPAALVAAGSGVRGRWPGHCHGLARYPISVVG